MIQIKIIMDILGTKYYSTKEVVDMFGISRYTWVCWRKKYGVKGHAMRNTLYYTEDELRKVMESNVITGAKPSSSPKV